MRNQAPLNSKTKQTQEQEELDCSYATARRSMRIRLFPIGYHRLEPPTDTTVTANE